MSKRYLVNSCMKNRTWTDEERLAFYMNPVDLSLYDHSEIPFDKAREEYYELERLKEIGVKTFSEARPMYDEPEIKTKYFKTYSDYLVAQDKVRHQIEFKDEPVDIDLEQKLIAETRWIKQQRVAYYNSRAKK